MSDPTLEELEAGDTNTITFRSRDELDREQMAVELEHYVAAIRQGEIRGYAIALVKADNSGATQYCLGNARLADLHFAMSWLGHRLLFDETEHEPREPGDVS